MLDEIKHDAAASGALLGAIIAAVLLYLAWSIGTWFLLLIVALIALGFFLWKFRGMIG